MTSGRTPLVTLCRAAASVSDNDPQAIGSVFQVFACLVDADAAAQIDWPGGSLVCFLPDSELGVQLAKQLVDAGASLNQRNEEAYTALEELLMLENYRLAEYLVQAGADPNQGAPLVEAVFKDQPDLLNQLLDAGARPDEHVTRTLRWGFHSGSSALLIASARRLVDVVEQLLACDASPGLAKRGELQGIADRLSKLASNEARHFTEPDSQPVAEGIFCVDVSLDEPLARTDFALQLAYDLRLSKACYHIATVVYEDALSVNCLVVCYRSRSVLLLPDADAYAAIALLIRCNHDSNIAIDAIIEKLRTVEAKLPFRVRGVSPESVLLEVREEDRTKAETELLQFCEVPKILDMVEDPAMFLLEARFDV